MAAQADGDDDVARAKEQGNTHWRLSTLYKRCDLCARLKHPNNLGAICPFSHVHEKGIWLASCCSQAKWRAKLPSVSRNVVWGTDLNPKDAEPL